MRAKQSPNESAQSRCIEQNAFKTFRRRRHEIDVVVAADVCAFAHADTKSTLLFLQKLRRVRICARLAEPKLLSSGPDYNLLL